MATMQGSTLPWHDEGGTTMADRWDVVLRARLEAGLEAWGHVVARRPWPVIAPALMALNHGGGRGRLEPMWAALQEGWSARIADWRGSVPR
jgi:hypothetical protein